MTQAAANFDTINSLVIKTETPGVSHDLDVQKKTGTAKTGMDAFGSILDKAAARKSFTLGDIKDAGSNWDMSEGDMSEKIENFKELLIQATQEANMEKSLDLTLAKDVNEIISQLQAAISGEYGILSQNMTENIETAANDVQSEFTLEEAPISKVAELNTDKITEEPALELDEDMLNELNIESVSAETENSNNESASQKETPEEFGVKVMLNQSQEKFDVNIKTGTVKPQEITPDKIVEQITKHLDSLKSASKVNIVLNPESLGKVSLQIMNSKDGLSAQFTVATNDVRDLLMKGLEGLKDALLAQGVGVDNITVKVSEAEESSYNPDWLEQGDSEQGGGEQNQQNKEEKEKGLFEKTIAESLKNENGEV